jgi:hypothetical protein
MSQSKRKLAAVDTAAKPGPAVSKFRQIARPTVVYKLDPEQMLITRNLQVDAIGAANAIHEYKAKAEEDVRKLQAEANAKSQVLMDHLTALAQAQAIDPAAVTFDFKQLAFLSKP